MGSFEWRTEREDGMKHKKVVLCVSVLALAILAVSFLWKPLRLDRFGNAQID